MTPTSGSTATRVERRGPSPTREGLRRRAGSLAVRLPALARRHWPALLAVGLYAATVLIVPVRAPVALSDDWVYTRSVEILLSEGRLHILDIAGATAIPQILWGAAFAAFSDDVFGAVRLGTVAFTGLSGFALYALCRELAVSRARSGLATAAYLFTPLAFSLSYTFMTDAYFMALLVLAGALYARGLRPGRAGEVALLLGSAAAAVAIAQRVLGVLIPVAVVTFLLLSGRLRPDRAGVVRFLRVVALPLLVFLALQAWLIWFRPTELTQSVFTQQISDATWEETWLLIRRHVFIQLMYVGLFALPLTLPILGSLPALLRRLRTAGWLAVVAVVAILAVGLAMFGAGGRAMPYVPQFLSGAGIDPSDLIAGHPDLMTSDQRWWLTYLCALAALLLAVAVAGRLSRRGVEEPGGAPEGDRGRAAALLCLTLLGWQTVAVLLPSFHFRNWVAADAPSPSVDRYMLVLLPFAIVLAAWAARGLRRGFVPLAFALLVPIGAFSVVGTHDLLHFQRAVWDLAWWANDQGVDNTRLSAGYAWDGYHLHELSVEQGIPPQTPDEPYRRPWWLHGFATATDSSYVVTAVPLDGYATVHEQPYARWLNQGERRVHLQRRPDVAGPP